MYTKDLLGKTLTAISPCKKGDDSITFFTADGFMWKFQHDQDCCECVLVEDICGDMSDLIDSPLLQAEETSSCDPEPYGGSDSFTWTFYKFATIKGSVTIRWLGESNGYYSEKVDLKVTPLLTV